jgi:hypothetical protein
MRPNDKAGRNVGATRPTERGRASYRFMPFFVVFLVVFLAVFFFAMAMSPPF